MKGIVFPDLFSIITAAKGMVLEPGESVKIKVDDGSDIYYIGTLGDVLHYVGG